MVNYRARGHRLWPAVGALWVGLCLLPAVSGADTAESVHLSGRLSALGMVAQPQAGEMGYQRDDDTTAIDQLGVRLMAEASRERYQWAVHVKNNRLHVNDVPGTNAAGQVADTAALFRYRRLEDEAIERCRHSDCTGVGHVLDRAFWQQHFDQASLTVGRQAVDWGSGRFWQPLNVFGAFAPTDLDTDYKPGIDAVRLDAYPSAFSSVAVVWVRGPQKQPSVDNSGAVHYRRQVGELSEVTLLGGSVAGHRVLGFAFDSVAGGMGWRLEATRYRLDTSRRYLTFSVAGIDYQLNEDTLLIAEWYRHGGGATRLTSLGRAVANPLYQAGLQPYLGRNVLGLGLNHTLSPLWQASWAMLFSAMENPAGHHNGSLLHQLNLTRSLSDESDVTLSVLKGTGASAQTRGTVWQPRSEFGHIPWSVTVRARLYF